MTKLTHAHSPLEQARKGQRVALSKTRRPLGLHDQAILKRLFVEKYEYVANELFELPEKQAQKQIFEQAPEIQKPDTSWYHPVMDTFNDSRMSRNTGGTVLLTAKQEQALFLQFNYCRFRVCQLRDELQCQQEMDPELARELLNWFYRAEQYRDQIAQTNLALVLAMAKRTRMSEVDFADLVSEGNMALLRAVDKFDVARGFKFSTYACRAILKAFSRSGVKLSKYRQMFPTDFDPKLERSNHAELKRDEHEDDCVDELRTIIGQNRADLTEIEQEVIEHRFAINKTRQDPDASPLTLEQVGKIIGVTKERVRQIQNKALDKIRHTLENEFLD